MSFARIFHKIFHFFSFFLIICDRRKLPIVTACQPITYGFRGVKLAPIRTDSQPLVLFISGFIDNKLRRAFFEGAKNEDYEWLASD